MRSDIELNALQDIIHHIDMAEDFARGRKLQDLRGEDIMALYAITRCLEIISEASRRLSDDLKARHVQMPWREMAAAGNFYRHNYEDVLPNRVWKTLREEIAQSEGGTQPPHSGLMPAAWITLPHFS